MRALRVALAPILVLAAAPARATDFGRAAVGTTGSEFLLMDTGARGMALGGAMTAATGDAASIYWNPAGLSQVPRLSATFMYARYVEDISYNAAAVAGRINDSAVAAAGVRFFDGGSITKTDISGLNSGSFQPRSYVVEGGWGQSIYDLSDAEMDVAMGVSARAIHTDLGIEKALGYSLDLGILSRFYTAAQTFDVGVVVQNMGVGQKFDDTRDTLPARAKFGASFRPIRPLALTGELLAPINNALHGAGGLEYTLDLDRGVKAAARAGFNSLTYESLGPSSCFSMGFGLALSDLGFDYAFIPMGALGAATHRVSLSFNLPAKVSRRYRQR